MGHKHGAQAFVVSRPLGRVGFGMRDSPVPLVAVASPALGKARLNQRRAPNSSGQETICSGFCFNQSITLRACTFPKHNLSDFYK